MVVEMPLSIVTFDAHSHQDFSIIRKQKHCWKHISVSVSSIKTSVLELHDMAWKEGKSALLLIPALLKPPFTDPETWFCKITIKLLSPCYLLFFPAREIKARRFPSPPHLDQISGRLVVDHGETLGDYGHSSLPVSVSLCTDSCNPGKSVRSHRWAASDPNRSLYVGIVSHLRACMQWVIVTVSQSANIETETSAWTLCTCWNNCLNI